MFELYQVKTKVSDFNFNIRASLKSKNYYDHYREELEKKNQNRKRK